MGVFYDWQWPDLGFNKPNDWICWPAAFGLVFLGPIFGTAMVDALAGVTDGCGAWLFGIMVAGPAPLLAPLQIKALK